MHAVRDVSIVGYHALHALEVAGRGDQREQRHLDTDTVFLNRLVVFFGSEELRSIVRFGVSQTELVRLGQAVKILRHASTPNLERSWAKRVRTGEEVGGKEEDEVEEAEEEAEETCSIISATLGADTGSFVTLRKPHATTAVPGVAPID